MSSFLPPMTVATTLAALQLLPGPVNLAKKDTWPWEWIDSDAFASDAAREQYRVQNDLDLLPDSFGGFLEFCATRRALLEHCLRTLLAVDDPAPGRMP